MRETVTEPVPAQPQRWWVDYLHNVQSPGDWWTR